MGDLKQFAAEYSITAEATKSVSTVAAKKYLLAALVLERMYALAAKKAGLVNDPQVQKALAWSDDQLLAGRYMRWVEKTVTLEDAWRYYQAHPEELQPPDQIRLRQMVVATPEGALAVQAALDRGELFEAVAKNSSIDRASAAKGGDIGWVRKGGLYPQIEPVAF
jgi:peptidyl-prolyl cis-trans isomerase C